MNNQNIKKLAQALDQPLTELLKKIDSLLNTITTMPENKQYSGVEAYKKNAQHLR